MGDCPRVPTHPCLCQVYTVELHIGKVVLGDRGDYRLEVKAKDVCDSCNFSIDVEGRQGCVSDVGGCRGKPRVGEDRGIDSGVRALKMGKGGRSNSTAIRVLALYMANPSLTPHIPQGPPRTARNDP